MPYTAYFAKHKFNSMLLAGSFTAVITFLVLLSDTLIVGNIVGENAISGITLVTPLYAIMSFFSGIIGIGATYAYQFAMGKLDREHANKIWGMALIASVALGIVMCLLMVVLRDVYFDIMNVSGAIRTEAVAYWKYEQFVVLLGPAFFLLSEIIFADGDELASNLSNIFQVVGNIIISIIACKFLGTEGASLGTLIGSILSMAILLTHFAKKSNSLHFKAHFSLADLKSFVKYALTDSIVYLCIGISFIIMTKFFIARFGDAQLPVLTVVQNIIELLLLFDGVGAAFMPLANVYVGEGNFSRECGLARYANKWSIGEGIIISILCFAFAGFIPSLYDINQPELVHSIKVAVRILSPILAIFSIIYLLTSHYVATGREMFSAFLTVLENLVFMSIFPIIFGLLLGINGMWLGCVCAPLGVLVFLVIYGKFHSEWGTFPWFVKDIHEVYNFDIVVNKESVVKLNDEIEEILTQKNVNRKSVLQTKLIFEDSTLLTLEKNPKKNLLAEVSIIFDTDKYTMILRNNGTLFDVTDADGILTSFRSNIVCAIMANTESRQYLMTSGFNRQTFTFPV